MENLIPKKIHFVWVGGKEKPHLVKRCIESWKKYCPDYEIVEWNDNILKDIDNLYVKQAYENKKWAFVSDYLRLYALYNHGGFYFDTDLEITSSIDEFRKYNYVSGYELWNGDVSVLTALIGARKGNHIIKELLGLYDNISFVKNGELDETTNVARVAGYLEKRYGFKKPYDGTKETVLEDGCILFPYYFFCTPENEEVNYSIHHFNGSWIDPYHRKCKFAVGKYKIVRFRKRPNVKGDWLPILSCEKKICEMNIFSSKYCILKTV